jgi:hypothetical protein
VVAVGCIAGIAADSVVGMFVVVVAGTFVVVGTFVVAVAGTFVVAGALDRDMDREKWRV